MLSKGNIKSRLFKVIDKIDQGDKKTNSKIIFLIKSIGDTDYYLLDQIKNNIPSEQAIKEHSIKNSKGELIPPIITRLDVVETK